MDESIANQIELQNQEMKMPDKDKIYYRRNSIPTKTKNNGYAANGCSKPPGNNGY